ncbi:mediator complex, subunit Med16 [Geopyxis carbonaria]|nr:mediator complex, subunit Med16 [Geopyxis carbonaria]
MEFGAVDDLFQDNATPVSHSRIDGRFDEFRRGGCNQKIAWSKLGCIAVINSDGTGVETRHLACNPEDGRWALSDAYPITDVSRFHEGQRLQHVTWSSNGAELAIIDVLGRVSFYTVYLTVNQLALSSIHTYPDDDMSSLVGFWWLPSERPYSLYTAMKVEEDVKYYSQNYRPFGPFHPVSPKAAAIGITRGGTAKMWFHDGNSKYQESTCELECMMSLDDVFTHASMSWGKESVSVLAAYTQSRQLRVYRLAINWGITQQTKPATQYPTAPVLLVKRVKLMATVFPTEFSNDTFKAQLTHLEVMGPTPGPTNANAAATITAIFSAGPDAQTITFVCRWDLRERPSKLHPAFDQLGVRRASISSGTPPEVGIPIEDITLNKRAIGVWPVTSGTVIAFAFSDGSLDFRDRFVVFRIIDPPPNGKITNMTQAGFTFTGGENCIDIVLSPNNTVAVRLSQDNELQMIVMDSTQGAITIKENFDTACIALAVQHAYSISNLSNNDDLLLIARKYKSLDFNNAFLTEVHRALNLKMDFAAESPSERLIRNPLLQRCLSLQYALDFHGERVTRRLSGKLAWAVLHLRVASLAFALSGNSGQRGAVQGRAPGTGGPPDDAKPEALQTVLGLVQWFMDMMSLIIGDLIELSKATRGRTDDLAFVRQKMLESNSPALFLTLASAPRAFLRYNCRNLRALENSTNKQLASGNYDEEQRMTIRSFKVPIDSCAVKIHNFEKIMTDIDGTVRAAYNNVPEAERATAERQLFVNNEIPEIFKEPVQRLLGYTIPNFRDSINISALFWHDVSWLGFHDDIESRIYHRTHRIDAVRKIVLPSKGIKLRRCTRCCSIVEETTINKNQGQWLQNTQRMCLCGTLYLSPHT